MFFCGQKKVSRIGWSGPGRTALNKWKVDMLPEDYYRFTDLQDPDLAAVLKAFHVNIPAKLYRRGELKALKSNMIIFT